MKKEKKMKDEKRRRKERGREKDASLLEKNYSMNSPDFANRLKHARCERHIHKAPVIQAARI
jgi:hypothetical protein